MLEPNTLSSETLMFSSLDSKLATSRNNPEFNSFFPIIRILCIASWAKVSDNCPVTTTSGRSFFRTIFLFTKLSCAFRFCIQKIKISK